MGREVVYTEFSVMHIFTSYSRWSENASQRKESSEPTIEFTGRQQYSDVPIRPEFPL